VLERISGDEDKSGMFHSIGYKVKSDDGREAFMKVTDLDLLTDSEFSVYERTKVAIQTHPVERQMLEHCRGNNMDRIVVAIDFGDTVITHSGGREPIFYLMFDLAEGDVRVHVDKRSRFDRIWTLGALHDLAVAIQQLHKGSVVYHLGSMVFFLIVGRMLTPEVIRHLAPEHRPPSDNDDWNGSLSDIIP